MHSAKEKIIMAPGPSPLLSFVSRHVSYNVFVLLVHKAVAAV